MSSIKGQVRGTSNIRVSTLKVGATDVNLSTKSINELSDVSASETDKAYLQYNQTTDKWEASSIIDGGTF